MGKDMEIAQAITKRNNGKVDSEHIAPATSEVASALATLAEIHRDPDNSAASRVQAARAIVQAAQFASRAPAAAPKSAGEMSLAELEEQIRSVRSSLKLVD